MKTASRIVMTVILMVFFAGVTFSQQAAADNATKTALKSSGSAPGKFVDTNKNGICDQHEAKAAGGQGKNFIDKNGDGKCDNCGTSGKCKGTADCGAKKPGCGKGCGKGQGNGNCCGQGYQHRNGCGHQGSNAPNTQPNK